MRPTFLTLLLAGLTAGSAQAQKKDDAPLAFTVTVKAGKYDRKNVPVAVPLDVPAGMSQPIAVALKDRDNDVQILGQLAGPALPREKGVAKDGWVSRELHFVVSELAAGKTTVLEGTLQPVGRRLAPDVMHWGTIERSPYPTLHNMTPVEGATLRPVLSYVNSPYDDSTAEKRNKTYKVFHHLYDPTGSRLLTNGGQADELPPGTTLLYPHHRGLFFGFNRVTYDDGKKKADVWHCQKDDHISHEKELARVQGPIVGRHRLLLSWHGAGKQVFAQEEREVGAYNVPGGTLVEWSTRVTTTGGPVMLDGDPQHAGFHFRAANEVAEKSEKETYFLRPDGKGKPNETRNWPERKDHINLPWNAMCFKLGDKRYTVVYLDHPSNPRETRHSERAYGRIGCYFQYELTKEKPLQLQYRIWLQEGEMTVAQAERLHRDFVEPPTVKVKME